MFPWLYKPRKYIRDLGQVHTKLMEQTLNINSVYLSTGLHQFCNIYETLLQIEFSATLASPVAGR